jgi:hypothetical protein
MKGTVFWDTCHQYRIVAVEEKPMSKICLVEECAGELFQESSSLPGRLSEQLDLLIIPAITSSNDEPLLNSIDNEFPPKQLRDVNSRFTEGCIGRCGSGEVVRRSDEAAIVQFVVLLSFCILLLAACVWTLSWSCTSFRRMSARGRAVNNGGEDEEVVELARQELVGKHVDTGLMTAGLPKESIRRGMRRNTDSKGLQDSSPQQSCMDRHDHGPMIPPSSCSSSSWTLSTSSRNSPGILVLTVMKETVPILLAAAAAATLLVLAAALVACLALWVLAEFLPERLGARLLTLLYWMVLLAVSLPIMYIVLHGSLPELQPRLKASTPSLEVRDGGMPDGDASALAASIVGRVGEGPGRSKAPTKCTTVAPKHLGADRVCSCHQVSCMAGARPAQNSCLKSVRSVKPWVPHILLRKGYHIIALLMFTPVLLLDPHMMQVRGYFLVYFLSQSHEGVLTAVL